ncbi:MAG: hypothetical protein WC989_07085 [Micavibrio sp.]
MDKLKELYNPFSDTFLCLGALKKRGGRPLYQVYRAARSPEYIEEQLVHSGIFSVFRTRDYNAARENFEKRLVDEAALTVHDFVRPTYADAERKSFASYFTRAAGALDTAWLIKRFGHEVFYYEVCDTPSRKLYAFERAYFGPPDAERMIPQPEAVRLLRRIAAEHFLFGPPVLSGRDKPKYRFYLGERREILGEASAATIPKIVMKREGGMLDKRILLHEMAHIVTDAYFGKVIPHGPHFAMVAAQLYDRYFGIDRERYFRLANDPLYRIFGPAPKSADEVLNAAFIDFDPESDSPRLSPRGRPSAPCFPVAPAPA